MATMYEIMSVVFIVVSLVDEYFNRTDKATLRIGWACLMGILAILHEVKQR